MCRLPEATLLVQHCEGSRAGYFEQSGKPARNSNVSKILPVTTFGTIDLEGRKIPGPLFSGFCAVSRVFYFERGARWLVGGSVSH
jgi:hypothetical protein